MVLLEIGDFNGDVVDVTFIVGSDVVGVCNLLEFYSVSVYSLNIHRLILLQSHSIVSHGFLDDYGSGVQKYHRKKRAQVNTNPSITLHSLRPPN